MQDVLDHALRVVELVEAQRDLVTGLLEANLAVASNRMNDVMKQMTSWGAILLGLDAHRRDLRHELRAHARAAMVRSAIRSRSA